MLSTRIDHDTKVAFSNIGDESGLSSSQAITLFARAVINYGGISFALRAPQQNETSVAAMQAAKDDISQYKQLIRQMI
jgi:DNA-damage-inducible protein J